MCNTSINKQTVEEQTEEKKPEKKTKELEKGLGNYSRHILFVKSANGTQWLLCNRMFKSYVSAENFAMLNYKNTDIHIIDVQFPE